MPDIKVVSLSPITTIALKHVGPYEQLEAVFGKLFAWVSANNVPIQRTIGVFWDNPEHVPASRLRSAACVEIPNDYYMRDKGGLPLDAQVIPGGEYATTTFIGPYEDLEPVWSNLTAHVENNLRREISEGRGAIEIYVNDPETTPPAQLITELYMPLV